VLLAAGFKLAVDELGEWRLGEFEVGGGELMKEGDRAAAFDTAA